MAENDHPILLLHKFLNNTEQMLYLEPKSLAEYKPLILQLKSSILTLQQQARNLNQQKDTTHHTHNRSSEEEHEILALKAEKEHLINSIENTDTELLKLLDQLRRLQFSLDAMDASAYQRPTKPKQ